MGTLVDGFLRQVREAVATFSRALGQEPQEDPRDKRIAELEATSAHWKRLAEVRYERLDESWKAHKDTLRRAEKAEAEVERLKRQVLPPFPKRCGCGASNRTDEDPAAPWECRPDKGSGRAYMLADGDHCVKCGEELKS